MGTIALAIMRDIHRHMDEEDLEKYSAGMGSAEDFSAYEEHLLVCEPCRLKLQEAEEYLGAMQFAARKIRLETPLAPVKRAWRFPVWIPAFAAVACVLVVLVLLTRSHAPQPAFAVALTALRSNGSGIAAPAGRDLQLQPDLTGLAAEAFFRLELVDQTGRSVWQGSLPAGQVVVTVPGQKAGLYFVRVSVPGGQLLREYGLQIH